MTDPLQTLETQMEVILKGLNPKETLGEQNARIQREVLRSGASNIPEDYQRAYNNDEL